MRQQQEVAHAGREPGCDQRRCAGDEAVDDHGNAVSGPRQHEAGERPQFQATQGREHTQGIAGVGLVQRQRVANYLGLAGQACVVDARAPAHHGLRVVPTERAQQRGRCRGVSDAHVATHQDVGSARSSFAAQAHSHRQGGLGLVSGHRGSPAKVFTASADALREKGRPFAARWSDAGEGAADADVDHGDGQPALARQHVDCGAPGQKVTDHGGGDLGGIGADALGGDAVIGREHEQLATPGDRDGEAAANARVPDGQIFQATQAARWLGELGLMRPRSLHRILVQRRDCCGRLQRFLGGGAAKKIRTSDPRFRRPVLYPAELWPREGQTYAVQGQRRQASK